MNFSNAQMKLSRTPLKPFTNTDEPIDAIAKHLNDHGMRKSIYIADSTPYRIIVN